VAREEGITEVRDITAFRPLEREPSPTFHGRDLFVPTGAMLADGLPLSRVGPQVRRIKMLALAEPVLEDGLLKGMVMRVGRLGNVVTNIPQELVAAAKVSRGRRLRIIVGEREFEASLGRAVADVPKGETVALLDSFGRLELTTREGSLSRRIGARAGQPVEVHVE
jgi:S-adenosylmethionine hydrolase